MSEKKLGHAYLCDNFVNSTVVCCHCDQNNLHHCAHSMGPYRSPLSRVVVVIVISVVVDIDVLAACDSGGVRQ